MTRICDSPLLRHSPALTYFDLKYILPRHSLGIHAHGLATVHSSSNEAPPLEARGNFSNRPFLSFATLIIVFVQQNLSQLTHRLYGTDLPGVFRLQGLSNPDLIAWPPGSIDLGVANHPRQLCGGQTVGHHQHACAAPATENDDLLSSGSVVTDALQAFISDGHVVLYGSSPAAGELIAGKVMHTRWRSRSLSAWSEFTILRHDPIACLGDGAIPAASSAKVSVVYAPLPPRLGVESEAAGDLAARVADPQLRLFTQGAAVRQRVLPPAPSLPSSPSSLSYSN
ncbi:hypothetical protein EDB89DRAFT_2071368 [Lactarius sanguifluus]|nr:hypothetical protein EDB89DRAFT_2071368 [Lactarius sanguifluus]